MLVILEDLLTQFVYQLVKTEVYLKKRETVNQRGREWRGRSGSRGRRRKGMEGDRLEVGGGWKMGRQQGGMYLCLHFIIEELLIEVVQGIVGTVTVQIQWVENVPVTQQKVGSDTKRRSRCYKGRQHRTSVLKRSYEQPSR